MLAALAALAICAPAQAQKVYSQPELDALLAPIALQPDGVVSQVLMAATYPEDVAAAAAWSRANAHLRGDDAVRAAAPEPWDPSVKSLLAFPDLLARMDESPQWLRDLGEAFLGQQAQVMDTVQGLRRRAQANGQLVTTNDTAVYQQGEAIVVQPRAEVVYVRYYDPYIVYGPWWWGPYYRPVIWRPWTPYPVVVVRGFFYSQPDWHHHYVRVIHRPVYVQPQPVHVVPGKWQHRPPAHRVQSPTVKPYVRVPESQRKPIVQSQQPMPAANGWSQSPKRDVVRAPQQAQQPQRHSQPQPRSQAPREQRSVEIRRQADQANASKREWKGRGQDARGREPAGGREQRNHRG
jgi:hypothetical protein